MAQTTSQRETLKRKEKYYPSPELKADIATFCKNEKISKSALIKKLLSAFFAAYKREGTQPKTITLLP